MDRLTITISGSSVYTKNTVSHMICQLLRDHGVSVACVDTDENFDSMSFRLSELASSSVVELLQKSEIVVDTV